MSSVPRLGLLGLAAGLKGPEPPASQGTTLAGARGGIRQRRAAQRRRAGSSKTAAFGRDNHPARRGFRTAGLSSVPEGGSTFECVGWLGVIDPLGPFHIVNTTDSKRSCYYYNTVPSGPSSEPGVSTLADATGRGCVRTQTGIGHFVAFGGQVIMLYNLFVPCDTLLQGGPRRRRKRQI